MLHHRKFSLDGNSVIATKIKDKVSRSYNPPSIGTNNCQINFTKSNMMALLEYFLTRIDISDIEKYIES